MRKLNYYFINLLLLISIFSCKENLPHELRINDFNYEDYVSFDTTYYYSYNRENVVIDSIIRISPILLASSNSTLIELLKKYKYKFNNIHSNYKGGKLYHFKIEPKMDKSNLLLVNTKDLSITPLSKYDDMFPIFDSEFNKIENNKLVAIGLIDSVPYLGSMNASNSKISTLIEMKSYEPKEFILSFAQLLKNEK